MTTKCSVTIHEDFLERLTAASPINALSELIWNGLDAEAKHVRIDIKANVLGGIEAMRKIHHKLVEQVRVKDHRNPYPSAVVIDSQSAKTSKLASIATRGFDGGKRVKGRKRHFVVDTNGLLLDVSVTPANMHDNRGGRKVLRRIARRVNVRNAIKVVYADKGYNGIMFSSWVKYHLNASVKVGGNKAKIYKRFAPEQKRWVVERTFAWIRDYRRVLEDMERSPKNSVTMIRLAFIRVMLRRLKPQVSQ